MNKKRIFKDAVFCILISLIIFFLLELAVRIFSDIAITKVNRSLSIDYVAGPPNRKIYNGAASFKFNSSGMRDYEYPLKNSKYRIAAIGDSFVYGFEVPIGDTIPKQIEKLTNWETLNFGRSGTTIDFYERVIYDFVSQYNLNAMLLFITYNDIYNFKPEHTEIKKANLRYYIDNFLMKHLALYQFFKLKREQIYERYFLNHRRQPTRVKNNKNNKNNLTERPSEKLIKPVIKEEDIDNFLIYLKRIIEYLNSKNIKLVVCYIDIPIFDEKNYLSYLDKEPDYWEIMLCIKRGKEVLSLFLKENNIPFIDLAPLFRDYSRQYCQDKFPEGLFTKDGWHYSSKGCLLIAKSIADYMKVKLSLEEIKNYD